MKQRLCALLLSLVLLAGLTCPAAAAKTDHFTPLYTYRGQFMDVAPSEWYYENVKALYELGLTNGQGTRARFAPSASITLAEAITMAARLRSLYELGGCEKGPQKYASPSGAWYSSYVTYAQKMGIIADEFTGSYGKTASRAQIAHILANALPSSLFTAINDAAVTEGYASRSHIPDVTEYTPYQQDILTLYRWGILSGMDRVGSFHPTESVQRSEVAAMLTRLAYDQLRITLDWDTDAGASKAGTTYADLVTSTSTFHTAPDADDLKAIDDNIRYMLSRGERSMTLHYSRIQLTSGKINTLLSAFLNGIRCYAEQDYNQVVCSQSGGTLTVTFSSSLWDDKLLGTRREAALQAAITVHDQLWESGALRASMSQYDKARVYYTWLCQHCQYDHAANDSSASHSSWGALINGLAVCDGYTAAYNLLLKLEGIDCTTMSLGDHIWTVASLDGVSCHIDPTWGDQSVAITYRYFAMTESVSLARFP